MKQTLFNIPEYNLEIENVSKPQRDFRPTYQTNGFKELGSDNLKTFINIKYNSMSDAKDRLQMSAPDIRAHYLELQRKLYRA